MDGGVGDAIAGDIADAHLAGVRVEEPATVADAEVNAEHDGAAAVVVLHERGDGVGAVEALGEIGGGGGVFTGDGVAEPSGGDVGVPQLTV